MTANPLTSVPIPELFDGIDADAVLLSVNVMDDGSVSLRGQGDPDAAAIAFLLRVIADQLD